KTTEQGKTSEQGDSVHKQESERLAMSAVSMIDTLYDRLVHIENDCLNFLISANSEIDCIDYLIETKNINKIINYTDKHNLLRIIDYIEGLIEIGDRGIPVIELNDNTTGHGGNKIGQGNTGGHGGNNDNTGQGNKGHNTTVHGGNNDNTGHDNDNTTVHNVNQKEPSQKEENVLSDVLIKIFHKHGLLIDQMVHLLSINKLDEALKLYDNTDSELLRLRMDMILHRTGHRKVECLSHSVNKFIQNDLQLKRGPCDSKEVNELVEQCLSNYGIIQTNYYEQSEQDNLDDHLHDNSHNNLHNNLYDRSNGNSHNNLHDRSKDNLHDRSNDNLHDRSKDNSDQNIEMNWQSPHNWLLGLPLSTSPLDFSSFNNDINGLLALSINQTEEEQVTTALLLERYFSSSENEQILLLASLFIVNKWDKPLSTDSLLEEVLQTEDCTFKTAMTLFLIASMNISSVDEMLTQLILRFITSFNDDVPGNNSGNNNVGNNNGGNKTTTTTTTATITANTNNTTNNITANNTTNNITTNNNTATNPLTLTGSNVIRNVLALSLSLLYFKRPESLSDALMSQLPLDVCVLVLGMCYYGTGRTDIIEQIIQGYNTDYGTNEINISNQFNPLLNNILNDNLNDIIDSEDDQYDDINMAVLSICLIAKNDKTLCYRIIRQRKISSLLTGFIFNSTNDQSVIDELLRGINALEGEQLVYRLFSLGLVCAGTNNQKVLEVIRGIGIRENYDDHYNTSGGVYNTGVYNTSYNNTGNNNTGYNNNTGNTGDGVSMNTRDADKLVTFFKHMAIGLINLGGCLFDLSNINYKKVENVENQAGLLLLIVMLAENKWVDWGILLMMKCVRQKALVHCTIVSENGTKMSRDMGVDSRGVDRKGVDMGRVDTKGVINSRGVDTKGVDMGVVNSDLSKDKGVSEEKIQNKIKNQIIMETNNIRYKFIERETTLGKQLSVIGLKGNPRRITGIYKVQSPVIMKYMEGTEMRNEEGVWVIEQ
ncbi:26S proteasome regulatory complex, subunit RM153/PSMD2, partial [Pseudoloma neurophilia]